MFSLIRTKRSRKGRPIDGDETNGDEEMVLLETTQWPLGPQKLTLCDPGDLKYPQKRAVMSTSNDADTWSRIIPDQYSSNCSLDSTDDDTAILIPPATGKQLPVFDPNLEEGSSTHGGKQDKRRQYCTWKRCKNCMLGFVLTLLVLLAAALIYFYMNINDGLRIAFGDRKSEMVMTWHSGSQKVAPTVVYRRVNQAAVGGDAPGVETASIQVVGRSDGFAKSLLTMQYINRVTLTNLTLGATYEYVYGEGVTSTALIDPAAADTEIHWFRVPYDDEATVSMAVFGDMGAFGSTVLPYLLDDFEAVDSFFGLVGDLWFSKLRPVAANLPYMVSPGNHESYWDDFNQYMNRFTMPDHAQTKNLWYSFEVGPVKVISISTEAFYTDLSSPLTEDDQMRWLEGELALRTNRTRTPWLITMSHRPMYCSNDDDDCDDHVRNRVRIKLEDILDHYNVTVAFWAHEHSYERTCSVYNGKCGPDEPANSAVATHYEHVPQHPVHVITGSAGSVEGFDEFRGYRSQWTLAQDLHWGFGQMRATYSSFTWSQHHIIDDVLTIVDHFQIVQ